MAKRRETGAGNVGCIISLAILAVAVILAVKVIPTRVAVAELQDFCERAAEQASLPRHTDEIITDEILIKAQQENLPLGTPMEYDQFHYEHQLPGGMLTNMKFQLQQAGLLHKFGEVLAETARVCNRRASHASDRDRIRADSRAGHPGLRGHQPAGSGSPPVPSPA